MQFRQGDLLFCLESTLPRPARPHPGPILAGGQQADEHLHLLDGPGQLYESGNFLYLEAEQPTFVWHPEHHRLALPAGTFRVVRQRQYQP
ncbi:MAG: hypothetical protein AMXMBFR33_24090 [Candidatus Xenobia bacterium]